MWRGFLLSFYRVSPKRLSRYDIFAFIVMLSVLFIEESDIRIDMCYIRFSSRKGPRFAMKEEA